MILNASSTGEYAPEKVIPMPGGHAPLAPRPIIWGHDNEPVGPPPPSYDDAIRPTNAIGYIIDDKSLAGPSSSQPSSSCPQRRRSFSSSCHSATMSRQTSVISAQSSLYSAPGSLDFPNSTYAAGPSTASITSSIYATSCGTDNAETSSIPDSSKIILRGLSPSASVSQLFNPPPPSFYRTPPPDLSYPPFDPIALLGISSTLEKGFPYMPPSSSSDPHPFASHDVSEQDWARFLEDVTAVAKAAPINPLVKGLVPVARNIRMPLGSLSPIEYLVKKGVEAHMKSRRTGPVGEVLDHWNHHFFHPRRMLVVLAQGRYVYSGGDALPADMVKTGSDPKQVLNFDRESDSDDDDGSILSSARSAVGDAMNELLDKSRKFNEMNKERNRDKRAALTANRQKWRLVISSRPYVL